MTKDGKAPIIIRLTIKGQRREIYLATLEKTVKRIKGTPLGIAVESPQARRLAANSPARKGIAMKIF
ncbi:hypothetical protein [Mucilaginibacter sp. CSA2-8R]|uniref:hypothetical protein n=1 Tax=Mucilaginibacter sp. CSA2-8R TaxID=3141542 RepID=UPI00315CAB2B